MARCLLQPLQLLNLPQPPCPPRLAPSALLHALHPPPLCLPSEVREQRQLVAQHPNHRLLLGSTHLTSPTSLGAQQLQGLHEPLPQDAQ